MDIRAFLQSFLHGLSALDFVEGVDFHSEAFVVKGRVFMKKGRFLQVYMNGSTNTVAFALIENEKRIWGVDRDDIQGWHIHPANRPETHIDCGPMDADMIIKAIAEVW